VIATGLASCLEGGTAGGGSAPDDVQGSTLQAQLHENLAIPESTLYEESGSFGVRGTVENTGERPMTNVEVHARLLDPDGGVLGEFYDDHADEAEVWRLAAEETDEFDVRFEETEPETVEQVVRYEVWADGTVE